MLFWLSDFHYSILRSLQCSSILPSLLLIPSSVFFITVIVFFSFDWFYFIFSCLLLKFPLCSFILFPNSGSILIINALNSLSSKLFHYLFLSGVFSCSFTWNKFLCLLILLNFLCLYEISWNSYLLWSSNGVLEWLCPYAVCLYPVALVGELDLIWAWITPSPTGVLAAITLVGGGARDGGDKARARCKLELLLFSVTNTPLLWAGLGPKLLTHCLLRPQ